MTAGEALNDPWFEDVNRQRYSVAESLVNKGVVRRLKEFRTGSDFQKEVIKLMVNIFDYKEEIQNLRHVFQYADYLNNGTINQEELKMFFDQLGVPTSEKEISGIISSMHLHEKGLITYSEFIAATVDREFYEDEENLEQAFRRFDVDNSGKITKENVKNCFARFGFKLDEKTISDYIADFDIHDNGCISKEEFFKMMKTRVPLLSELEIEEETGRKLATKKKLKANEGQEDIRRNSISIKGTK